MKIFCIIIFSAGLVAICSLLQKEQVPCSATQQYSVSATIKTPCAARQPEYNKTKHSLPSNPTSADFSIQADPLTQWAQKPHDAPFEEMMQISKRFHKNPDLYIDHIEKLLRSSLDNQYIPNTPFDTDMNGHTISAPSWKAFLVQSLLDLSGDLAGETALLLLEDPTYSLTDDPIAYACALRKATTWDLIDPVELSAMASAQIRKNLTKETLPQTVFLAELLLAKGTLSPDEKIEFITPLLESSTTRDAGLSILVKDLQLNLTDCGKVEETLSIVDQLQASPAVRQHIQLFIYGQLDMANPRQREILEQKLQDPAFIPCLRDELVAKLCQSPEFNPFGFAFHVVAPDS